MFNVRCLLSGTRHAAGARTLSRPQGGNPMLRFGLPSAMRLLQLARVESSNVLCAWYFRHVRYALWRYLFTSTFLLVCASIANGGLNVSFRWRTYSRLFNWQLERQYSSLCWPRPSQRFVPGNAFDSHLIYGIQRPALLMFTDPEKWWIWYYH
jgi:hypothetical protein